MSEEGLQELFSAYDLDHDGKISREEFFRIEIKNQISSGQIILPAAQVSAFSLFDQNKDGFIDYNEFKRREFQILAQFPVKEQEAFLKAQSLKLLNERRKLGPVNHPDLREKLLLFFSLLDLNKDNLLDPLEWLFAQKLLFASPEETKNYALIASHADWLHYRHFLDATKPGQPYVQPEDFVSAFILFFQEIAENQAKNSKSKKPDSTLILQVLDAMIDILHLRKPSKRIEHQIQIFCRGGVVSELDFLQPMQTLLKTGKEVLNPQIDETLKERRKSFERHQFEAMPKDILVGAFPSLEDLESCLKMYLQRDFVFTLFHFDFTQIKQLKNSKIAKEVLESFSKADSNKCLFMKNIRLKLQGEVIQELPTPVLEGLQPTLGLGKRFGLDWKGMVVDKFKCPEAVKLRVGDVFCFKLPVNNEKVIYRTNFYLLGESLQGYFVESVAQGKGKKKVEKDQERIYNFFCTGPGKVRVACEVSWEEDEETLLGDLKPVGEEVEEKLQKLATTEGEKVTVVAFQPLLGDSVFQLGPLEIEIEENPDMVSGEWNWEAVQFWNGAAFSTKKNKIKK